MTALNFSAPVVGSNISLNGNATANRVLVTGYIDVVLNNNEYIFIRFFDVNSTGPDAGMAIDDLTVAWETAATGDETYLWNVAGSGAYSTSSSWSPNRTLPSATDRLIFSQGPGTTLGPFNVVNETVSQVIVDNSTSVTMNPGFGTNVLTATDQFIIGTGSTLSSNNLNLAMSSATNSFSGGGNLTLTGTPTVSFHAAAPAFPTGTVTIAATSTINYAGDRDQTVIPRTDYGNVRFSGATVTRTKTLGAGNLSAAGAVQVHANNVFNLGGSARVLTLTSADSSFSGVGTLDLGGAAHTVNIADATPSLPTTFTPGTSSTVVLNRSGNQTIPATTYANLSLTTGGIKTLTGSTTAAEGLTLSRPMDQAGFLFTLGSASTTGSLTGGQRTFGGLFRRFVNASTAALTWPVSVSATDFRSVSLQFNSSNEAGAYVEMQARDYQANSGLPDITPADFPLATELGQPGHPDEIFSTAQVMNVKWDINYFDPIDALPANYDISLNSIANVLDISGANSGLLRIFKSRAGSPRFEIVRGFSAISTSIAGFTISSITHTGIDQGFSQFYIGTLEESTVLPVTWLAVAAERVSAGAEVSWSTASELNNERFEVQRSTTEDFGRFVTVGQVAGRGTSQAASSYRLIDTDLSNAELMQGPVYYRIRQVDFDGRSSLSRVVRLDAAAEWAVYPNPVTGPLQLVGVGLSRTDAPVQVQLMGADGRLLVELTAAPATVAARVDAAMNQAGAGLYVLRVGGKTIRLVKP